MQKEAKRGRISYMILREKIRNLIESYCIREEAEQEVGWQILNAYGVYFPKVLHKDRIVNEVVQSRREFLNELRIKP